MTPEEQIENLNRLYAFLTREERLLLARPWLNPSRIRPDVKKAREQVQEMIDGNIPVLITDTGFSLKK